MDSKTENAMPANLLKNTGKSLDEWIMVAQANCKPRHSETVKWLKENHNLGLFFADLIVHKANGTDAASYSYEDLIDSQYNGKVHLKVVYEALINEINSFGDDIEIIPKKAYVSIRRKKQFACLKPATKTRFEVDLIINGQETVGVLLPIVGAGAMCTHRIKIEDPYRIDAEIINWLKIAYSKAI